MAADRQQALPLLPVESPRPVTTPPRRLPCAYTQATALACLWRQGFAPSLDVLPHASRLHLCLFGCACASRILRRSPAGPEAPWAMLRILALLHGAWLLQR